MLDGDVRDVGGNALEMLDGTASNCHSGFIPGSPFIVRGNRARDTEGNSVEIAERECTGNVRRGCRGVLDGNAAEYCPAHPTSFAMSLRTSRWNHLTKSFSRRRGLLQINIVYNR